MDDDPSEAPGDEVTSEGEAGSAEETAAFEGVGDGRKKHVVLVGTDGERYEEGDAFLRHADDAFIVSLDPEFPSDQTRRFEKTELREVEIDQPHPNCFITTAVAGDGPTLDLLREFRDDAMAATPVGRALVRVYYAVSPPVATTLERHPDARTTRVVRTLIETCATIARRRRECDSVQRLALSVVLTALYVVGVVVAIGGHTLVRAREFTDRLS